MSKTKKPTVAELTKALQRERADAENLRRRHAEEIAGLKNHLKANVVRELLPLLDNLDHIEKHRPERFKDDTDPLFEVLGAWDWINGIDITIRDVSKLLEKMGVERIKTVGEPFNPHLHEAISVEGDEGHEVVSEELQPGYKIGNDIIRHAMVKVKMQSAPKPLGEGGEKK